MSDNCSLAQISRKYVEKECPFCHKNLTKSAYYEHTQLRGSCVKPAVRTNGDGRTAVSRLSDRQNMSGFADVHLLPGTVLSEPLDENVTPFIAPWSRLALTPRHSTEKAPTPCKTERSEQQDLLEIVHGKTLKDWIFSKRPKYGENLFDKHRSYSIGNGRMYERKERKYCQFNETFFFRIYQHVSTVKTLKKRVSHCAMLFLSLKTQKNTCFTSNHPT